MVKHITLKDIAADMNISRTTVHRAINGKDGISEELRTAILARAKEMGYTRNYVASSLKRRAKQLAVVLPEKSGQGRFYNKYIWDAIDSFMPEVESLNVKILPYSYEHAAEQIDILEQLFNDEEIQIDGLLTVPANNSDKMSLAIERFSYKNIPVVLIDSDLEASRRLCCIAPHDYMIGRLGAEIVAAMTPQNGKILVAAGDPLNAAHAHNLKGFQEYIKEQGKNFEVMVLQVYSDNDKCYNESCRILKENPDICAFYAVTARNTVPLAQAVIDSGLAGRLRGVGSDLFPESAELLRQDVLQALIYKNAYDKGYKGFEILFSYVVKNIQPNTDKVDVPISIIMKNNLHSFNERI